MAKFAKSVRVRRSSTVSLQVPELTPEEEEAELHGKIVALTNKEKDQLKRWQQAVTPGPSVKKDTGRDWLKSPQPSPPSTASSSPAGVDRPTHRSNRTYRCTNDEDQLSRNASTKVPPKFSWKELPRAACLLEADDRTLFIVPSRPPKAKNIEPVVEADQKPAQADVEPEKEKEETAKDTCRLAKSCVKTPTLKPWEPLFGEPDVRKKQSNSSSTKKQDHGPDKPKEADASAIWAGIRTTAAFAALVGR